MRTCSRCGEAKAPEEFGANRATKDGRHHRCKACERIRDRERYHETPEQASVRRERAALSKAEAKAAAPQRQREADRVFRLRHPKKHWAIGAVSGARQRARDRGMLFDLTPAFIASIAPDRCPALDIPLDYSGGGGCGLRRNSPTVDRVDNLGGYTRDNIMVISGRANSLKSNGSLAEFLAIAKYMARHQAAVEPARAA